MLESNIYRDNITEFKEKMNRLFDAVESLEESEWSPDIDILEDKDDIIIKADIPGMSANEINLTIDDKILYISGNRKRESDREDENYHYIGRNYGKFERSISLPVTINIDETKAIYKDGVLIVRLPKIEKSGKVSIQLTE
jgi:HSP20 family protein